MSKSLATKGGALGSLIDAIASIHVERAKSLAELADELDPGSWARTPAYGASFFNSMFNVEKTRKLIEEQVLKIFELRPAQLELKHKSAHEFEIEMRYPDLAPRAWSNFNATPIGAQEEKQMQVIDWQQLANSFEAWFALKGNWYLSRDDQNRTLTLNVVKGDAGTVGNMINWWADRVKGWQIAIAPAPSKWLNMGHQPAYVGEQRRARYAPEVGDDEIFDEALQGAPTGDAARRATLACADRVVRACAEIAGDVGGPKARAAVLSRVLGEKVDVPEVGADEITEWDL